MERAAEPRPRRLDEAAVPGWVNLCANLLRGGGIGIGLVVGWLGFLTGGFFLVLTGVLAVIAIAGGLLLANLVSRASWYERPNAKPISFALVFAFPVLLIAFAQLAGPALTPPPTTAACFEGELARGAQADHQLPVDPRIGAMSFSLSVPQLEGGALRWFVTDPVGDIKWGGRVEQPGFSETADVAPAPGTWIVSLIGEADRAGYLIAWAASTGPASAEARVDDCPAG